MPVSIKEMIYERERSALSPKAFLTENTRGREHEISQCDVRTEFQRDRDRIIHSKSFRRLMHKTQVFLSPEEDHYRTRLTHTFEVSQIGRTIARGLCLNEDLCEAISLGHDLGHTPFGHAGERVLQKCYDPNFRHYNQSLRVVEKLENLNLTYEVRDGIKCHTLGGAQTLEGKIVKYADKIAYINHDIDDALRAGILKIEDIPCEICDLLGNTHGERINCMVVSIIKASSECGLNDIVMEHDTEVMTERLHNFLNENVYKNPVAKGAEVKASALLERLYEYFVNSPDSMPDEYKNIAKEENVGRAVADYISGMTDRYAINLFKELFIPEVWNTRKVKYI